MGPLPSDKHLSFFGVIKSAFEAQQDKKGELSKVSGWKGFSGEDSDSLEVYPFEAIHHLQRAVRMWVCSLNAPPLTKSSSHTQCSTPYLSRVSSQNSNSTLHCWV